MRKASPVAFLGVTLSLSTLLALFVVQTIITQPTTTRSFASESSDQAIESQVCGMSLNIYVNEELADGSVVPFDFSTHPDTDPEKWGFVDALNMPPYTATPIVTHFNARTKAQYDTFVGDLSFVTFPKQSQIYPSEQRTSVQLRYQDDSYEIVRREIQRCSIGDSKVWLCGQSQADGDVDTISEVPVRCGMNLGLGWVVKKNPKHVANFMQTAPAELLSSDITGDGKVTVLDLSVIIGSYGTNDPHADINKDGKVNGLDYSLIVQDLGDLRGM